MKLYVGDGYGAMPIHAHTLLQDASCTASMQNVSAFAARLGIELLAGVFSARCRTQAWASS